MKIPDYSKSKIYRIKNTINDKVYIGSTCNYLSLRKAIHKHHSRMYPHRKLYSFINEIGFNNCIFEIVELFPCENNQQLREREEYHMNQIEQEQRLNENSAIFNRDKFRTYQRLYKQRKREQLRLQLVN